MAKVVSFPEYEKEMLAQGKNKWWILDKKSKRIHRYGLKPLVVEEMAKSTPTAEIAKKTNDTLKSRPGDDMFIEITPDDVEAFISSPERGLGEKERQRIDLAKIKSGDAMSFILETLQELVVAHRSKPGSMKDSTEALTMMMKVHYLTTFLKDHMESVVNMDVLRRNALIYKSKINQMQELTPVLKAVILDLFNVFVLSMDLAQKPSLAQPRLPPPGFITGG